MSYVDTIYWAFRTWELSSAVVLFASVEDSTRTTQSSYDVNRKAKRKGAEIEQLHRQSQVQSRFLLSVFSKMVSRGQVSLGRYPSDIRGSVYFTADFQTLENHELDRRNSMKIIREKERERETNIKVIVGWDRE